MRMKHYIVGAAALAFAALSWGSGLRAAQPQGNPAAAGSPAAISQQKALIDRDCVPCDNRRTKTPGLAFDTRDLTKLPEHCEISEKTIMTLLGQLIPPPNARQPQPAATQSLISWLETTLGLAAAKNP